MSPGDLFLKKQVFYVVVCCDAEILCLHADESAEIDLRAISISASRDKRHLRLHERHGDRET